MEAMTDYAQLIREIKTARWGDTDIAEKIPCSRQTIYLISIGRTQNPHANVTDGIRDLHNRLAAAGLIKFVKLIKQT